MTDTKSIENLNIENISFEEALRELETIVKKLDSGSESLDTSIKAYERASVLKSHCEKKLEEAKFKIEKISKNAAGDIVISEQNS